MRSSAGSVRAQLILLLSAEEWKWKPSHWSADPLTSRATDQPSHCPPLMEHSAIITGTQSASTMLGPVSHVSPGRKLQ